MRMHGPTIALFVPVGPAVFSKWCVKLESLRHQKIHSSIHRFGALPPWHSVRMLYDLNEWIYPCLWHMPLFAV